MSKPIRLVREARAELHEAARRYGEQRPELRIEFLAAVDETMERMVRLAKHLGSRRASIPPSASSASS
jgi:hypothetical protein